MGERTQLLIRQVQRHRLAAAAGFMVFLSCLLSGGASLAALRAEDRATAALDQLGVEVENRLYAECIAFNEGRESNRELSRAGDIESGEALIESVTANGQEVDPTTIQRYRTILARHLDALLKQHAEKDRDCEEEQRMRRALDD